MAQIGPSKAIDQRDRQTYSIIGCAMEVHCRLGWGFLEPVYQAALEMEFDGRAIAYQREVELAILYKRRPLACGIGLTLFVSETCWSSSRRWSV